MFTDDMSTIFHKFYDRKELTPDLISEVNLDPVLTPTFYDAMKFWATGIASDERNLKLIVHSGQTRLRTCLVDCTLCVYHFCPLGLIVHHGFASCCYSWWSSSPINLGIKKVRLQAHGAPATMYRFETSVAVTWTRQSWRIKCYASNVCQNKKFSFPTWPKLSMATCGLIYKWSWTRFKEQNTQIVKCQICEVVFNKRWNKLGL